MATIEDIKKLLESKSFTSARDLDEFEEKQDDKQNEVRLNCEPMVGMVEKEGKIFLNSVRFSKAWNSLGKDIPIKQGNAFPLGQGDVLGKRRQHHQHPYGIIRERCPHPCVYIKDITLP